MNGPPAIGAPPPGADSLSPGNIVIIELQYDHVTEVFCAFGKIGRSAEAVAQDAVQQCRNYLKCDAPVGEYLTDQLLLPLAIAGAGSFRSTGLSLHSTTHIELIGKFLAIDVQIQEQGEKAGTVVSFFN